MDKLITVTARFASQLPLRDARMQIQLDMTHAQKVAAVEAIVGTFTIDQIEALKEQLDKEFAT